MLASRGLSFLALGSLMLIRPVPAGGCTVPLQATRTSFVAAVMIGAAGPFRFLLDTGTSMTVLSSRLADRLAVKPSGTLNAISTTGVVKTSVATLSDVRAGTLELPQLQVLITDLPSFRSHGDLDGILGMDALKGRSFLLDVKRACLTLDVDAVNIRGGSRMEAVEVAGRVAIKSGPHQYVLDSAASFTVLMSPTARKMLRVNQSIEMTSAAGTQNVPAGVIPLLRLGAITLRNIPAALSAAGGDPREDALLPLRVFKSIYVDASRRFVILDGKAIIPGRVLAHRPSSERQVRNLLDARR